MTRLKLILCAGALGLFSFTASADAAAINGEMNISGTVNVSEVAIDFIGNTVLTIQPGTDYFSDIYNTNQLLPFSATSLDLTGQPLPLPNFLSAFVENPDVVSEYDNLSFTLTSIVVPAHAACTGAEAIGVACTLGVFRLTNTANGVSVEFDVNGFFVDPDFTDPNTAIGLYTAQVVGETVASIIATLDAGGSIENSFSATFEATGESVPEPLTLLLLGSGFSAVAYRSRRRAVAKS